MLKQLTIQNYALISQLEINFPKGLSVITGETGAGKSIIIGALSLILGQRADAKSIRQDKDKCLIEGLFDISSYGLEAFFAERELEYDAHNCLIRREIWNTGKSRAFINDTPASLNDLKDLGAYLIDIHSQHQNLGLADNKFQLQVLDILANNQSLKKEYVKTYRQFLTLRKRVSEWMEKARAHSSEQDYLRFQFQQLNEAKLKSGEQSGLEAEAETLSHLEEIKNGLYRIEQGLAADNASIFLLKEMLNTAQAIHKLYPPAGEIGERLQNAYLDLKDMLLDVRNQQEKLDLNPERLQWINERLDVLYSLQQKHKVTSAEELITLKNHWEIQLQEIENYDETIAKGQEELEILEKKVLHLAQDLTETRKQAAILLEQELVNRVSVLGMPFMQFHCRITAKQTPETTGMDDVNFLFSANKNIPVKPVSQTASGGEISRLMLGIKALIAGTTALPSIIFDEIDTGVSGEVADKMGGIMHRMAEAIQVIAITHLPQIAARGDSQFFVYKENENEYTETLIRSLSPEERVKEIAQMLSGSQLTQAAIENARELLAH